MELQRALTQEDFDSTYHMIISAIESYFLAIKYFQDIDLKL